ncbi:M10 family metallopeptidase [Ramlibacter sp.]|uniref:M10 family metallopeptidase n=1 Tax=Ramlibacter sp. TaxID=1917967 RepID=UPI002BD45422|nr:M10 family metallopeptidase [Ramlibacter sp.]HWI84496.1 M10 family metallopeptidase [Ramlibacter sp.]
MSLLIAEPAPTLLEPAASPAGWPLHAASGSLAAAPAGTVIAYPYTGDYRIDVLLDGTDQSWGTAPQGVSALAYRWNAPAPLGTPPSQAVTYSFMSAVPWYGGNADSAGDSGFQPFTSAQRTATRQIMATLSTELGITLVEVGDSSSVYGQIRLGNNSQQTSSGYSWLPYSTGDDRGGDIWIDDLTPGNLTNVTPGTQGFDTLLHEIGHALGLKHPGNYNAGDSASTAPGNYLGSAEDNENYTIMSYQEASGFQPRDWYGMYDLLALKALYGSRGLNAGDTVYSYTDASGRVLKMIDDAAGFDTIDISAVGSLGSKTVDMRPGTFSSVGMNGGARALNNLSIDFSTVVERFVGTPYSDTVTGNDANNTFVLGTGANVADGGVGLDLAVYAGTRGAYQAAASGSGIRVTGSNVSDTLTSVERLAFADGKLAFDIGGNAGLTAKIIGAVFGPQNVAAHPDYVSVGLGDLDAGMSYADLMSIAINYQLGASHSNEQLVNLLYTNVAGVAPTAEQAAPYLAELYSGARTQAGLGIYAADLDLNVQHVNLAGLAQTGLWSA